MIIWHRNNKRLRTDFVTRKYIGKIYVTQYLAGFGKSRRARGHTDLNMF